MEFEGSSSCVNVQYVLKKYQNILSFTNFTCMYQSTFVFFSICAHFCIITQFNHEFSTCTRIHIFLCFLSQQPIIFFLFSILSFFISKISCLNLLFSSSFFFFVLLLHYISYILFLLFLRELSRGHQRNVVNVHCLLSVSFSTVGPVISTNHQR